MCGRFTHMYRWKELHALYSLFSAPVEVPIRYNVAPSQTAPVIIQQDGRRDLGMYRWGLIPSWATDLSIGYKTINARAETIATAPSFRAAFKARRCLVPISGFYEWQKLDAKHKQPWYFTSAEAGQDGTVSGLLTLAGLWERWQGPEGEVRSFTIITTTPNDLTAKVHDRMPVILEPEEWERWLTEGGQDLLRPCSPDRLIARKVSTHVNKPSNDDAACVETVE